MTDMYSSPTARAKDEYWLNQDRIEMTTEERIQRHKCDCILTLAEEVKKLREHIESTDDLNFMTELYKVD